MKRLSYLTIAAMMLGSCSGQQSSTDLTLYVGTYGDAIHAYSFDAGSSAFSGSTVISSANPSYIAFGDIDSQGRRTLYAVNESGASSSISSFAEGDDGQWTLTGKCSEIGDDPCFVRPLSGTPFVLTADYTGGVLSVFRTNDGAIAERCQAFAYASVYPDGAPVAGRQESAHIHQVKPLPQSISDARGITGEWVLASDLGNDLIHVLALDPAKQEPLRELGQISCGEGAGPRHMEFNVSAGKLYCITELSGEVIVWDIDANDGNPQFTEVQRIKADEVDAGGSADIHISPDGRFLYASHRLQNDGISIFSVSPDGLLTKVGYQNTGAHPRNFAILPDGTTMLVACRDDKSIEVYDINESTGLLTKRAGGLTMVEDSPVCVLLP